jgi:hypothetical protein
LAPLNIINEKYIVQPLTSPTHHRFDELHVIKVEVFIEVLTCFKICHNYCGDAPAEFGVSVSINIELYFYFIHKNDE